MVAIASVVQDGTRRLVPFWSDKNARHIWKLEKFTDYSGFGYWSDQDASGDLNWAMNIAKHYRIDVPKPT